MTGPPIANALVSGLKAYKAGAAVELVTYHKAKGARVLCCGFALLGRLQENGSCSRSPLTRAHAHREIPSRVPFLGYDFQFDAPPAALSVLLCQLSPGFFRSNECRPINRGPVEGSAKLRILSFGHRRRVS